MQYRILVGKTLANQYLKNLVSKTLKNLNKFGKYGYDYGLLMTLLTFITLHGLHMILSVIWIPHVQFVHV